MAIIELLDHFEAHCCREGGMADIRVSNPGTKHIEHYLTGSIDWDQAKKIASQRALPHEYFFDRPIIPAIRGLTNRLFAQDDYSIESVPKDLVSVVIVRADLCWDICFSVENGSCKISADLLSTMYGKSTVYDYVTVENSQDQWEGSSIFESEWTASGDFLIKVSDSISCNNMADVLYNTVQNLMKRPHPYQYWRDRYGLLQVDALDFLIWKG